MEDVELIKKIYIEKEKENNLLKEELANLRKRNDLIDSKSNFSNSYISLNKSPENDTTHLSSISCYTDREDMTNIPENKNMVKNIQTNISDMKCRLNFYEKTYSELSHKLNQPKTPEKINKLSEISNKENDFYKELLDVIKKKDEEILSIRESYEKELKVRNEIYNQNIQHINLTCKEDIQKIRLEYEDKMNSLIKRCEEEKIDYLKKIQYNDSNNDLIEFQKKYMVEMKNLQSTYESFKIRTFEEFKILKQKKDDIFNQMMYYKNQNEKLIDELNLYKDNLISVFKSNQKSSRNNIMECMTPQTSKNNYEMKLNEYKPFKHDASPLIERKICDNSCLKNLNDSDLNSSQIRKKKLSVKTTVLDDIEVNYSMQESTSRELTPMRKVNRQISNNRNKNPNFSETDENIIELPIQLKISGKIKKKE